jgi:(S)-mandelate dehydrogenase
MLDGGIRRGSDIAIACCLGSRFLFTGRSMLYGAAVGGRAGIKKALDIYARELDLILAQIGCPAARNLGPRFLRCAKRAGFEEVEQSRAIDERGALSCQDGAR